MICLCLSAWLTVQVASPSENPSTPSMAPIFALRDVDGRTFDLARHVGGDATEPRAAVVIAFVDPDDSATKKEVYALRRVQADWQAAGVEMIHVTMGANYGSFVAFAQQSAVMWRVLQDHSMRVAGEYGAGASSTWVVVRGDGTIAARLAPGGRHPTLAGRIKALRAVLEDIVQAPPPMPEHPDLLLSGNEPELHFARLPADPEASKRWAPLAEILREQTAQPVLMESAPSYAAFEQALSHGEYDLVNVGPVLAHRVLSTYEPLVELQRAGQGENRGIFFSKPKAIKRLADLKGKRLALVSPHSTSGGVLPLSELIQVGVDVPRDVHIVWTGSHRASLEAVRSGRADAGACYSDCRRLLWPSLAHADEHLPIFHATIAAPLEVVMVRRDLPASTRRRLKEALMTAGARDQVLAKISAGENRIVAVQAPSILELYRLRRRLEPVAAVLQALDARELAEGAVIAKPKQEREPLQAAREVLRGY